MNSHDFESITPDNWSEAAAALCRAAMTYESLLMKSLERHPELFDELIRPYEDELRMFSAVIGHWRRFLEITDGVGGPDEQA